MLEYNTIPDYLFQTETTFDKYFMRVFFNEYVLPKEYYPYQFDGWNDKKKYGIVDNKNNIIYPKQSYLKTYTNNLGAQHKNLLFVADAFREFKKYNEDLLKKNKISNTSVFFRMNVQESTADVPNLYFKFLESLYIIFKNNFLLYDVKNEIKNIDSFIPYFITFIKYVTKIVPINRSKFIGSQRMPASINGLRISVDNPGDNLDIRLIANKYIANPQFDLFIENAGRFGFYVDKNVPWTIVADLESPAMKKYSQIYNLHTTDQILDTCYHKAYLVDMESLINVLLIFWNNYVKSTGVSTNARTVGSCSKIFIESNKLNQLTVENFERSYDKNWQLRFYFYTRILEEKLDLSQAKFEIFFSECISINKIYGLEKSLEYINNKLLELKSRAIRSIEMLTTEEEVVKVISQQSARLPAEGLIF